MQRTNCSSTELAGLCLKKTGVADECTLTKRIETALAATDPSAIVLRVRDELVAFLAAGELSSLERFRRVNLRSYARRLLHADPEGRYTVVVMTWGPGQSTALHDHAGIWCVEGVVEGELEVTQYTMESEAGGLFFFRAGKPLRAGTGSAGSLIPPHEHHTLQNITGQPSISLHVYGGEIRHCSVYSPQGDGWYSRQVKELWYDE